MKKNVSCVILFLLIMFTFTGCNRTSYPFNQSIDEIETIEIVWAESSLKFTVTKTLSKDEKDDFLEQFQTIKFFQYLGDPSSLYGDSIKITYSNGDYEMICCYTAEYVKNGDTYLLFKRCYEDEFNKLFHDFS